MGGGERSSRRASDSRWTAKPRMGHTVSVNQRAIQQLGADLQQIMGTLATPPHLLLLAQTVINQMIHHRFDMRSGDALTSGPLIREIRETSAITPHIISELFDDPLGTSHRLNAVPRVLFGPSMTSPRNHEN